MTQTGIFAKTFQRDSVETICKAVKSHGFDVIQFNMACVGLPSMPDAIPESVLLAIQQATQKHNLQICGISGTYNMCHPDPKIRNLGLKRLKVLAQNCKAIRTNLITLCTGTRNSDDKWAYHPDNSQPEAWRDLVNEMEKALRIADKYNLQLGIEPELANVVSNPHKALQLITEMGSDRLKIILDPANLFEKVQPKEIERLIDEAIDLLAPHIVMAHAKGRNAQGHFVPPGKGIIPFPYLLRKLKAAGVNAPLVAHGFEEENAGFVSDFLESLVR